MAIHLGWTRPTTTPAPAGYHKVVDKDEQGQTRQRLVPDEIPDLGIKGGRAIAEAEETEEETCPERNSDTTLLSTPPDYPGSPASPTSPTTSSTTPSSPRTPASPERSSASAASPPSLRGVPASSSPPDPPSLRGAPASAPAPTGPPTASRPPSSNSTRAVGSTSRRAPDQPALFQAPGSAYAYRTLFAAGGFAQVPALVADSPALSPTAKTVYTLLIRASWQNPQLLITQKTLAYHTPCSLRTVQRALAELEAIGLVTIQRNGLMQPNLCIFEELSDALATRLSLPTEEPLP